MGSAEESFSEIREAVRALCTDFPGEYWRSLDATRTYPEEFVKALTRSGFLVALIPEKYGGSGLGVSAAGAIPEEIHGSGCNGAACHAQIYTMGTILRHGSTEQKAVYLPSIAKGDLRLQAFGVTEPTCGTDTTRIRTTAVRDGDHYVVDGQKVFISRTEHSDLMVLLARTTPRGAGGATHRRHDGAVGGHARGSGQRPCYSSYPRHQLSGIAHPVCGMSCVPRVPSSATRRSSPSPRCPTRCRRGSSSR